MKCDEARRRLEELDGAPATAQGDLAEHLSDCPSCRREVETISSVVDAARDLGPIAPKRDLWPEIVERIDTAEAASPRQSRSSRHLWPLAASLLVTAGLALFVARRDGLDELAPPAVERIHVVPWEEVITASRIRANEALAARADEFPEETQIALAENLDQLDRAIREIQQAIVENPGHPALETLLASRVQQHARLIQRISHV